MTPFPLRVVFLESNISGFRALALRTWATGGGSMPAAAVWGAPRFLFDAATTPFLTGSLAFSFFRMTPRYVEYSSWRGIWRAEFFRIQSTWLLDSIFLWKLWVFGCIRYHLQMIGVSLLRWILWTGDENWTCDSSHMLLTYLKYLWTSVKDTNTHFLNSDLNLATACEFSGLITLSDFVIL